MTHEPFKKNKSVQKTFFFDDLAPAFLPVALHYGTKVSPETIIKVEFFFSPKMNAHFRLANYWLSKTGDIPTAQKSKSALSVKTPCTIQKFFLI